MLIAAIAAVGMLGSCQKPGKQVHLRLQLAEGASYTLRLISEQLITQTLSGRPEHTSKMMGMGFVFDVEDVDADGIASVNITMHSTQFRQEIDGQTIEFDSRRDSSSKLPLEARGIAACIGQQFTAVITPYGIVKRLEGIDTMIANIAERLFLAEGVEKETALADLRAEFGSGGALKETIENLLAIYPREPVTIGESWQRISRVSEGLPLVLNNTWTLKSIDDNRVVIGVQANGKTYEDNSAARGGNLHYDLHGKQEGAFVLDPASGWILDGRLTQRVRGRVLMEGTQQLGQNLSWYVDIESTTMLGPLEES